MGMTVVELLIIVAALAVVITLAVPGSSMLVEHYRLKAASAELVNGLNLARGEAIKRGSTVKVCPSSNGRFCRSDGDWAQGWLVYSDGNGDGTVQDIELIQSFEAPNVNVRVVARGATQQTAGFTVAGLVPVDGSASGEFVLCHAGSARDSRTIMIDSEGWVSLATTPAQACNTG
ncbi:MAG: GspH/FimT family pseudopilin [Lysobacterales bacterium]